MMSPSKSFFALDDVSLKSRLFVLMGGCLVAIGLYLLWGVSGIFRPTLLGVLLAVTGAAICFFELGRGLRRIEIASEKVVIHRIGSGPETILKEAIDWMAIVWPNGVVPTSIWNIRAQHRFGPRIRHCLKIVLKDGGLRIYTVAGLSALGIHKWIAKSGYAMTGAGPNLTI
jgi:hypothetical protein